RLLGTGVVVLLLVATLLALARAVFVLVAAAVHRRRHRKPPRVVPRRMPPVTVIVPAYNEAAGIEATLRSILASTHPAIHVLVVDDGSTDETAQIVRWLDLPNVTLLSQPNAGKAAALNTGIRFTRTDIVVMVDGDTVLEPDTVPQLLTPFTDPRV